LSYKCKSYF